VLNHSFSLSECLARQFSVVQIPPHGSCKHVDSQMSPTVLQADNPNAFTTGNRIATFIMYLTDVELGGATAFPRLGAAVWPEKVGTKLKLK